MGTTSVQQMADRVAQLLEQRLRLRGKDLATKLRRGRRLLPRRIRREGEILVRAALQAQVPRLSMQIDHDRVARAYHQCISYLGPLGQGARVRGYLLDAAAGVGLALVVTTALVLGILVWRGYL
ncbi:hypothetical protein V8J36_06850 [Frigidibacter sp. MR17.14]|uniref:hypothetical protein n=1 Tax=Frigidibacter sp. MR17.14 TaxID=3126509 RepID=UPI003012DDE8